MENIVIRELRPSDWEQVVIIYKQGIATEKATFQLEAPTWEYWDNNHLKECRLVAVVNEIVLGWFALTPTSGRCFYKGVAEVSVYINTNYLGQGIGSALFKEAIPKSEQLGFWTLESRIFPQNIGSIQLHEKFGFRNVGYREKLGQRKGIWLDVILLERRSKVIG